MRKTLFIVLLILIIISSAVFAIYKHDQNKKDKEFLSKLKGEVVFTRSEPGMNSEILKYNFQDQSVTKIYQCDSLCEYPKWSEDGEKIIFYKPNDDMTDSIYRISSKGTDLQLIGNTKLSAKDMYPNIEDISIKSGDLFIVINGQEKLIYDAKYDGKFNTGVSYVSWGHDKKYLIFVDNRYTILIADTNGKVSKLTSGSEPDWKY